MGPPEAENSRGPLLKGHMTLRNSLETFRLDHRQGLPALISSCVSVPLRIVTSFPALDMVALHIIDCPWINFWTCVCFANYFQRMWFCLMDKTLSVCVHVCEYVCVCACESEDESTSASLLIVPWRPSWSCRECLELVRYSRQRSTNYHLWAKFSL